MKFLVYVATIIFICLHEKMLDRIKSFLTRHSQVVKVRLFSTSKQVMSEVIQDSSLTFIVHNIHTLTSKFH